MSENFCFLCLETLNENHNTAHSIFENILSGISSEKILLNFTKIVLKINYHKDTRICDYCCDKLKLIYDFTIACNLSQDYLLSHGGTFEKNLEIDCLDNHQNDDASIDTEKPNETIKSSSECPICHKSFASVSNRNLHLQLHNQLKFECNECKKVFNSKLYLSKHIKFTHVVAEINCPICSKVCKNKSKLDYHMRAHDPKRRYFCNDIKCNKSFMQPHHLRNHIRTHKKDESPLSLCPMCGKGFRLECNFKRHLKQHTDVKDKRNRLKDLGDVKVSKKLKTQLKNSIALEKQSTTKHPYVCKVCNRSFKLPSSLVVHSRIHTATDDRKFHCDLCKSSFKRAEHLRIHINGVHLKIREYKCEYCPKTFTQSGDRNQHMLTHSSEKLFSCGICKKEFRLLKVLKAHNKIHNGQRNFYHCTFCEEKFNSYATLCRHTTNCNKNQLSVAQNESNPNNFALITLPLEPNNLQPISTATVVITVPVNSMENKTFK